MQTAIAVAVVLLVLCSIVFGFLSRGVYDHYSKKYLSLYKKINRLVKQNLQDEKLISDLHADNYDLRLQVISAEKRAELLQVSNETKYAEGFEEGQKNFAGTQVNALKGLISIDPSGRLIDMHTR